jgi:hypothetical protein
VRVGLIGARLIGAAVFAALVIGLLLALILAVDNEQDAAADANRSERTIALAALTERTVLEGQSSVRGYLLTGDERLLGPWRSAQTSLPRTVDALVASTAASPCSPRARARSTPTRCHTCASSPTPAWPARATTGSTRVARCASRCRAAGWPTTCAGQITQLTRTETADLAAQRRRRRAGADRAKAIAIVGTPGSSCCSCSS